MKIQINYQSNQDFLMNAGFWCLLQRSRRFSPETLPDPDRPRTDSQTIVRYLSLSL
ncbi:hypothetical protein M2244_001732 [Rhodoferax antarcticus]|uniref:Uncharacterized protein n=1 Tax=Rhodoferax antarcticus ANT.BR TaxID=1111071 RepID=A0A1Q8YKL8_9BURK|nr:hypothetical protein [Rhodoferax antarcticus]OLP08503.1 hypothetical protein BLL52_0110 [Rhodoferax antarcticus ANT.BR]